MNHSGSHRKQQQRDGDLQQASTSKQKAEGERKRECNNDRCEKHYSIQSQRLVNYPDDRIVEPLPGQPWPSAHGVGERIGPRDHVRAQHEFTIADVPSDSSISQQTCGKHTVAQQNKHEYEDEIGNRWQGKVNPTGRESACARITILHRILAQSGRHKSAAMLIEFQGLRTIIAAFCKTGLSRARGETFLSPRSWRFSSVLCRLKPLTAKSAKKSTKFAERSLVMHSLCVWASI